MLGDDVEEGLAIRTIADMIETNDEKGLSDLGESPLDIRCTGEGSGHQRRRVDDGRE
jgi:hypothetical protein